MAALRHDLRTPLNQIIGYSELVAEDLEGDGHARTRQDLEKIGRAARGLADLITREIQPGRIALVGERAETANGEFAAGVNDHGVIPAAEPVEAVPLAAETAKILIVDDQ